MIQNLSKLKAKHTIDYKYNVENLEFYQDDQRSHIRFLNMSVQLLNIVSWAAKDLAPECFPVVVDINAIPIGLYFG